jgi:hypothetical protein
MSWEVSWMIGRHLDAAGAALANDFSSSILERRSSRHRRAGKGRRDGIFLSLAAFSLTFSTGGAREPPFSADASRTAP